MTAESLQALFLRAHVALIPEGSAARELLNAGVSAQRALTLYPYEFADWIDGLTAEHRARRAAGEIEAPAPGREALWRGVGLGDFELHARLRGIEEESWRLHRQVDIKWRTERSEQCTKTLESQAGLNMLREMGFVFDANQSGIYAVINLFAAADEVLAIASQWPALAGDAAEADYRALLAAVLAALLPSRFSVEHPPVRHDTMMFR